MDLHFKDFRLVVGSQEEDLRNLEITNKPAADLLEEGQVKGEEEAIMQ